MRKVLLLAGALGSLCVANTASAADCPADAVLVRGSSASQKVIEAVAKVAAAQNIKIIYSSSGSSCTGGVYEATTAIDAASRANTATALTSYDSAAPGTSCTMNPTRAADIGVSDVYASSCAGVAGVATTTLLPDVTDTLGPIQAFTLAVHDDPSFPVAISAEAAFDILGVTGRGGDTSFAVAPWSVATQIFGRGTGSGTWQTWARTLGLVPAKPVFGCETPTPLVGGCQAGASNVLSMLNTTAQSSAIGIIALNDIVPTNNVAPTVRPLAFKAVGQDFAYYPSSTSTASDMINVRDGHYATWANLHFFGRKNVAGDYSASVKTILGMLEGQDATAAIAKMRAVPKCAMQVQRAADAGDFSAYKPTAPCGCFFEQTASGTAPAACKACTTDNAASVCGGTQQCVFGFCEDK